MTDSFDDRLRDALAALPRDIEPPPSVLEGVRAQIAAPPTSAPASPAWYARPRMLAAAAIVLVALSSGVTALLLDRPHDEPMPPASTLPVVPHADGAATLVAVMAMERSYQDAIAEVQRAIREQNSALAPETLRVLQANLDVIDRALAEAREALHTDPGNDALAALVRSGYERKLDVLRSVSSHGRARS